MSQANSFFNLARLWLVVGFGLFLNPLFVPGIQAQSAESSTADPHPIPTVTNLAQLSKLIATSSRIIAGVRLDVVVCSTSRREIGAVAVIDKTGSELLEWGPRANSVASGDVIHLESQRCLLRKRELGVEISSVPDLDNDGVHALGGVSADLHLTAGLHPFQLDYFNRLGDPSLRLTCRLPDGSVREAGQLMFQSGGGGRLESNRAPGLNAAYYVGGWLNVPDFALLEPFKTVTTTNINPSSMSPSDLLGIRFNGFFSAPVDGDYSFNLESANGSLVFLDTPELPFTMLGHQAVPAPITASLHTPMVDPDTPKWMSVEGRVVFTSKSGNGFRFELRSQPVSVWVMVADGRDMDSKLLLNCRIRVAGIGRAALAPDRDLVLGELSVATGDDLSILEDSAPAALSSHSARPLTTVAQIQSLSKEESARHLPVRIQGVVTSLAPSFYGFMTMQDETRGTFVQLPPPVDPGVAVGQFCQVEGFTDSGNFAPIVVARHVLVLGTGQMPPPAHPSWKELINGSMDIQWVEFQGLVTAVHSNYFALFLPEGELEVQVGAYSESQLKACEGSVVRLRGVLFAGWNTNRTVQVGQLALRNSTINIDIPAPPDPFAIPLKSWRGLFQFDSRATPFQRVKVGGVVIYAQSKWVFLLDNGRGIRVSCVQAPSLRFGDWVEAVGYPDIGGPAPLLREAQIRKTGRVSDPTPLVLNGNEILQGNFDSMLVRISATLMGIHSEPDAQVLEMNAGGRLFLARLPYPNESISLQVGSQLTLTGVWVGNDAAWSERGKPGGFELLLNSPSQLKVLSKPSWWTPQRLLIMVGLLFGILILSTIWISELHRLVEERTRELQKETREREMAEREQALETERSRIARDLHDDLGSSLTEISVLASKAQRIGTLEDLKTLFRAISVKARGLVTALDIIVWAVDPKDNSLESVADYLGDFASEYLSHSGIACRFDIPVALPSIVLEGRTRHGLLLAVKETLNNIERHAQATEVEFRMTFSEGRLEIIITDNGRGFDKNTQRGGNGLKNLPLRLSRLGGHYEIDSAIGQGTTVAFGLNLMPRTNLIASTR